MTDAEYVAMEKRTNVRSHKQPRWLPVVRTGNRALSALAPALAAGVAEHLFLTPPRSHRPPAEIELLATARARPMRVSGRRIETWTWGAGPTVLLVHGWGGRGAQHGSFVGPLVARGAIARTARRVRSSRSSTSHAPTPFAEVEIRDLTVYEALLRPRRGDTDIAPPPEIAPPEGTERVADDGVSVHHEDAAGLPSGAWS